MNELDNIKPVGTNAYTLINSNHIDEHVPLFFRHRTKYYKSEIYFRHATFEKISNKIKNENIIFITGNPLSGKTRIVYDTLARIPNKLILIPKSEDDVKEYRLPSNTTNLVIFIDELDVFCKNVPNAINSLLSFCFDKDIKCIITCRTGPEFSKAEKCINGDLFTELLANRIEIPRFTKPGHDLQKFIKENKWFFKNAEYFDGNLGSLILPMREMKLRYTFLQDSGQNISVAILQGLKLHYHLFNYERSKNHFDEGKIKAFVEKYVELEKISPIQWENCKKEILSTPTRMNFIEEDETCLIIEEAYLDFHKDSTFDVIAEEFNMLAIRRVFKGLYKNPYETAALGFPTSINDWNKLIKIETDYDSALKVFNNIPPDIECNKHTYELMLQRANDKEVINTIYDTLQRRFNPNNTPNSIFIGKISEFAELLETFAEKNKQHLKYKTNVSARLIKLAKKNPKESLEYLFRKYSPDEIYSNYVFSDVCKACLKSKDDFNKFVKPYLAKAHLLEENLFKALIRICIDLGEQQSALNFLEKYFAKEDYYYLNEKAICLSKLDVNSALNLFGQAINLAPNPRRIASTYNNYCQLVYDAQVNDRVDDAIAKCYEGIKASKLQHAEFPFLRQTLLLLTIFKSNEFNVIKNVQDVLAKQNLGKATVMKIIHKVYDQNKLQILLENFKKSDVA